MNDSAPPASASAATSSDPPAATPSSEPIASDGSSSSAAAKSPVAWWTRPITRWLALLFATAVVLYLCWLMVEPFVDVLLWAAVLVIAFNPVHQRILARLGKPGWSAALSCLIVIVTILLPLALVTLVVLHDARNVAQYVQENKDDLLHPDPGSTVGRVLARVDRVVDIDRFSSREYLAQRVRGLSSVIASRTLNAVGGVVGALVQIFFVIFTMYYFFRDAESIRASLRA